MYLLDPPTGQAAKAVVEAEVDGRCAVSWALACGTKPTVAAIVVQVATSARRCQRVIEDIVRDYGLMTETCRSCDECHVSAPSRPYCEAVIARSVVRVRLYVGSALDCYYVL